MEKLIFGFVSIISDKVYNMFVVDLISSYTINYLEGMQQTFRHFMHWIYDTYVTFQLSTRTQEGKVLYGGEQNLYGFKTKVPVLPVNLEVFC